MTATALVVPAVLAQAKTCEAALPFVQHRDANA
jgi:hypothetical protein